MLLPKRAVSDLEELFKQKLRGSLPCKVTTEVGSGNDLELRAARSTAWAVAFGRPTWTRESMFMNPTPILKDSMGTSCQADPGMGKLWGL